MRVVILTAGSLGDVQPYVALGAGLRRAGLDVRLATHDGFRALAEAHGLEFAPVALPERALVADPRWRALQHAGDTPLRYVTGVLRLLRQLAPLVGAVLDDHWAACQGADAVVGSASAFAGPRQAAALGVPYCWALLQPMTATAAYPHFMTPAGVRVPPRASYAVADRIRHRLFGAAADRWALARLGAAPPAAPDVPVLYGISPALLPPPDDWPAHVAQVGSWFLDGTPGLPPELEAFLDAGPAPVLVHAARIGRPAGDVEAMGLRVLARLGRRGLFTGASSVRPLSDAALALPPVPFDRLLGRVAAVVHHGGAGTTATALRAGVPCLGIPGSFDQPFWSARVAALGAGPRPLPARRLTEARLEAALAELVQTPSLRARARDVGARIAAERGVETAVARLGELLLRGRAGRHVGLERPL